VLGISTDNLTTLRRWAAGLKLSFPLLSDADGAVSEAYGILIPGLKVASRTTVVVDRDGRIAHIEQGGSAIDPSGAMTACSRLAAPGAK